MDLLIDKAYMIANINMSKNFDSGRLDNIIRDVQRTKLRDLLGDDFFFRVIDEKDEVEIQAILNDGQSSDYYYTGIKLILAHLVESVYVLESNIVDTQFGHVQKKSEYTDRASLSQLQLLSENAENKAMSEFKSLEKYLIENKLIYPEYKENCNTNVLRKITKI